MAPVAPLAMPLVERTFAIRSHCPNIASVAAPLNPDIFTIARFFDWNAFT